MREKSVGKGLESPLGLILDRLESHHLVIEMGQVILDHLEV